MNTILDKLCKISRDWYTQGSVSRAQLVEQSGARARASELKVDSLREHLAAHPSLIDWWQQETEDIRGVPAWFFEQIPSGEYEVGYINRWGEAAISQRFADRSEACATYILCSLADLLGIDAPLSQQTSRPDC